MICALAMAAAAHASSPALFEDATERSGLDFVHFNGMSGELYFVEMVGHGGALFDYDNDGDLDAFIVQGGMLGKPIEQAWFPPRSPLSDRLYRNDLGKDGPRWVDVTASAGIEGSEYGMGVASGDFDNDGHVDLYVTNFGRNRLWRNLGNGRFEDVTSQSGTGDEAWSVAASFLDFDGDGLLDLYVANYVEYSLANNTRCFARSTRPDYCGPASFAPARDRLYRNLGRGRFEDVTRQRLRNYQPGAGLGVVSADFNDDGRIDIYVANDGDANQLWLAQTDGSFVDDALFAGAAVNRAGRPEASMGVDAGDFDNDGDLDLFMTHLMGETNTLYVNQGKGLFEDRTSQFGLGSGSSRYTGFGTAWLDFDNDGWLDLLILNGAVRILERLHAAGDRFPLDEPNQLFRNLQGKRFDEVTQQAGKALLQEEVSRGAAFGDVDNDGDTDALIFNNNGQTRLWLNQNSSAHAWIGLRLVDPKLQRDVLGALAQISAAESRPIWRRSRADGSYASANDPRILAGLGTHRAPVNVEVQWPDGSREKWTDLSPRRYHQLNKGEGESP
ncbi:CRTAC1 family protein [Pseudomarimonas arenosa]|uniref:CRTAC1 family protein n=1 Tax=Pseudomarimonas arenosa TaxID=2774145 RepID=A0AAW3ZTL3_9GAMM|nr:CRTAC1 family protein [Pseudomarimonas arenosa]MBD8527722.1 CRTAC1 family protein [Pseudomarimonas arenosa]